VVMVKEIFYSIQGEGAKRGQPAVFVRVAGCNLWSGREEQRKDAICQFCDTDFLGGTRMMPVEIVREVIKVWPSGCGRPSVVFTGGEPLLQVDAFALESFQIRGFHTAVETNGTVRVPDNIDWLTVSPKAGTELHETALAGDELKVVWPQELDLRELRKLQFSHFWLQPKWVPCAADVYEHERQCIEKCLADPRWGLSLQEQRALGIK